MTDRELTYLGLDDIVHIHGRIFQIDPASASDRLRDPAALASAVVRPANYAAYAEADLAAQAAILAHGIA